MEHYLIPVLWHIEVTVLHSSLWVLFTCSAIELMPVLAGIFPCLFRFLRIFFLWDCGVMQSFIPDQEHSGLLEKELTKKCIFHQEQQWGYNLVSQEVPFAFLGICSKSCLCRNGLQKVFLGTFYCLSEERVSNGCLERNNLVLAVGALKAKRWLLFLSYIFPKGVN